MFLSLGMDWRKYFKENIASDKQLKVLKPYIDNHIFYPNIVLSKNNPFIGWNGFIISPVFKRKLKNTNDSCVIVAKYINGEWKYFTCIKNNGFKDINDRKFGLNYIIRIIKKYSPDVYKKVQKEKRKRIKKLFKIALLCNV